jgi:hypothetical protein
MTPREDRKKAVSSLIMDRARQNPGREAMVEATIRVGIGEI